VPDTACIGTYLEWPPKADLRFFPLWKRDIVLVSERENSISINQSRRHMELY
jgi:hypothetical protein